MSDEALFYFYFYLFIYFIFILGVDAWVLIDSDFFDVQVAK